MADNNLMEKIVSLCKRRGFVFQGSEIYGGLAGTWDYGPLGVALKNNIKNIWWSMFVEGWEDMYGVDAAILMNPKVWEASGHVAGFSDPLIECKSCNARFRADHLIESYSPNMDASQVVPNLVCPNCNKKGTMGWPRQFNMMFKTHVGA